MPGKIIGTVNYYWENQKTRWLDVGIDIYESSYWNRGLGAEALTLWLTHLFEIFEVERIGLTTWPGNMRMMKCAEKLRMKLSVLAESPTSNLQKTHRRTVHPKDDI